MIFFEPRAVVKLHDISEFWAVCFLEEIAGFEGGLFESEDIAYGSQQGALEKCLIIRVGRPIVNEVDLFGAISIRTEEEDGDEESEK